MRSPYVIAACLAALRIELEDNVYALQNRFGYSKDDLDALFKSVEDVKLVEKRLREFRFPAKSVSEASGSNS